MTDINENPNLNQRAKAEELLSRVSAMHLRLTRSHGPGRKAWGNPREGQGRVLAILALKPEITQRELNYLLGMSRQALAELLSKLEKQGLITRTASSEDRRVMQIELTEAGRRAAESLQSPGDEPSVFEGFSDEDIEQMTGYLHRMIHNLQSQVESLHAQYDPDGRFRGDPRMRRGGPGGRRGQGGPMGPWKSEGHGGYPPCSGWEG